MSIEQFTESLKKSGQPDNIDQYRNSNERIQGVLITSRNSQSHIPSWDVERNRYYSPSWTADMLDPSLPTTQAAMWTGAISNRSRNNSSDHEQKINGTVKSFSEIWKGTKLEPLANICDEALEDLKPKLNNQITEINIGRMKTERKKAIYQSGKEWLVFLGLNGAGKDWMISHLQNFLELIGVSSQVIKMPNPDGTLFPVINQFLHGEIKLSSNAAQFLMMSDALDTDVGEGKLAILNRHPAFDAMVYGEQELQPTILSTHPLFDATMHTIIVDRHPVIALKSVKERGLPQRIFEKKLDAMVDIHTKYVAISYMPGIRWLNVDFSMDKYQEQSSIGRMLAVVQSTGIVQRRMVRMGIASNEESADKIYNDKWWDYPRRK